MHILFAQAEVWSDQKDCRARPSTYRTAVFNKDGRRARPSLHTLPGTDGTIGRQGPGIQTGRLGTLSVVLGSISFRSNSNFTTPACPRCAAQLSGFMLYFVPEMLGLIPPRCNSNSTTLSCPAQAACPSGAT